MTVLYVLIPVLFLAVSLLIWAKLSGHRAVECVAKPTATVLVIAVALLSLLQPGPHFLYTLAIAVGLVFSLGGDVALMFHTGRWFLTGLLLFLVAHVIYSIAFTVPNGFHSADVIVGGVLLVLGAAVFAYLHPRLGRMTGPVLLYLVVILFMASRAASTLFGTFLSHTQAWLATVGALLFMVSDLLLAVNRFGRPFRAEAFGLYFYYAGQLLIALSAWRWA